MNLERRNHFLDFRSDLDPDQKFFVAEQRSCFNATLILSLKLNME